MILNATQSQPLAFFVFVICGIIFGLALWLILFIEKLFATKMLFNIVVEGAFCALLFCSIFLIEKLIFSFYLHYYHLLILFGLMCLTHFVMSKVTHRHTERLSASAIRLKEKWYRTKLMKFIKK